MEKPTNFGNVILTTIVLLSGSQAFSAETHLRTTTYKIPTGLLYGTPTLGHDAIGEFIVFEAENLYFGHSVMYQRLIKNSPAGPQFPVSDCGHTYGGHASGDHVVFQSRDGIELYCTTGETLVIADPNPGSYLSYAGIYGDTVAWFSWDYSTGIGQIMTYSTSTGEYSTVVTYDNSVVLESLAVGDRFIVWSLYRSAKDIDYNIFAYDIQHKNVFAVDNDPLTSELQPATNGPWIVYLKYSSFIDDQILAYNVDTGEIRLVAEPVSNSPMRNIRISGSYIAYIDGEAYLYRLQIGDTFQIASENEPFGLGAMEGNIIAGFGEYAVYIAELNFYTEPEALAGSDRQIYLGDATMLEGSAIDPDGLPIESWEWAVTTAPPGSTWQLAGAATCSPTFIPDQVGDYVLSLIARDANGPSDPSYVTVHVINWLPPFLIAKATPSSTFEECFDAGASYSPQGSPLQFLWDFGDGETSDQAVVCHTFPGSIMDFNITVTATDSRGIASQTYFMFSDSSELNIGGSGPSFATVTVDPLPDLSGWDCGQYQCSGFYSTGTLVTVYVEPIAGYIFQSWDGCPQYYGMNPPRPTCFLTPNYIAFLVEPAMQDTPVGSDVGIIPQDAATGADADQIAIVFEQVMEPGATTVLFAEPSIMPQLPVGYEFQTDGAGNPVFFDIKTTATFAGLVEIAYQYDPLSLGIDPATEDQLRLIHWTCSDPMDPETCTPLDVTEICGTPGARPCPFPSPDTDNHIIYGLVSSFSWFTLARIPEPCVSAITLLPGANPSGWNTDDVNVNIELSGCSNGQEVTFGTSGAQTIPTTTADSASFVVTAEGTTFVSFSASGEISRSVAVHVDKTEPNAAIVAISQRPDRKGYFIMGNVHDTVSGVMANSVIVVVSDRMKLVFHGPFTTDSNGTIVAPVSLNPGTSFIRLIAKDNAGNIGKSVQRQIVVPSSGRNR